jgi:bacterioferritin B
MLIGKELVSAFNEQIGHEFGASMQYLAIAGHFDRQKLVLLAKLFYGQAEEEKEHALKFVHFISDTGGELQIPAIPAPKPAFGSAEEAVQAALNWEKEVTDQINRLMDLATAQNDYLAQNFLAWFVDEQLEEVMKMDQLLNVVRRAGERNLLMVEAYLVHLESAG